MKALALRGVRNAVIGYPGNKNKDRRWWIIPFMLAAIPAWYFVLLNSQGQTRVKAVSTPQLSISSNEIKAAEESNPSDYITGQVKMRRNFVNEIIVEGSLRNIARYTNYRDPVLRVDFLSKTGAILFTTDYKIQGLLHPNSPQDYKFKYPASNEVARISGRILDVGIER